MTTLHTGRDEKANVLEDESMSNNHSVIQLKLKSVPNDSISRVSFFPSNTTYLGVSSWDGYLRIYDAIEGFVRHQFTHLSYPILDFTFSKTGDKIYTGGLDNSVLCYDLKSQKQTVIGSHKKAVRCVGQCHEKNVVISGSWDTKIKVWDSRASFSSPQIFLNSVFKLEENKSKIYAMDMTNDGIVVAGTSGRKLIAWDLKYAKKPIMERMSVQKHQIRCIKISTDKQGLYYGTMDGNLSFEFFTNDSDIQAKRFSFPCHQIVKEISETHDEITLYPLSSICTLGEKDYFVTGGSEGYVKIWDATTRKKVSQTVKFPTGIASLASNDLGSMIAIGCSYLYEPPANQHPKQIPQNLIYIQNTVDL